MEDYKKKYEDAMSRLEKAVENGLKVDPATIFPELKISNDEPIRRMLVKTFRILSKPTYSYDPEHFEGFKIADIIAWLEKQKETKQYHEWSDTDSSMVDALIAVLKENHASAMFSVGLENVAKLGCDLISVERLIEWLQALPKRFIKNNKQ